MGLKTTNYEVKELGITLPNAYAIIHNLTVRGNYGVAEFYIQATRDNAFKLNPLERKTLTFEINRNESPYKTAYRVATEQYEESAFEEKEDGVEEIKVMKDNIFTGWENDLQDEE